MRRETFTSRIFRDEKGQVLLFSIVLALAIIAFLLVVPNATRVTTQKVRAQTAADVGSFTGSIWLSRSLNLNANMNIGIRSIHMWMVVLTMGEALAQALYKDTSHASVREMGEGLTLALLGTSDPVTAHSVEYPGAIQQLDAAALWLRSLQDDISASFSDLAAALGSEEASRTVGSYPATQTAGGRVLVRTNDTIPLLAEDDSGDALIFADLAQLGSSLEHIPTGDSNITDAHGLIIVSPTTWDVWAYYTDSSRWYRVRQVLKRMYQKTIIQVFYNTVTGVYDTAAEYRQKPGKWMNAYLQGDSWGHWVVSCNESVPHTPFIWPNGVGNEPYKNSPPWIFISGHPSDNRYKRDTVWQADLHIPKNDTLGQWIYTYPDSGNLLDSSFIWIRDSGDVVDTSTIRITGVYVGAESTIGHKGGKVRPRRVNPDREFHTVAYAWRQEGSTAPYGMGAKIGGKLFPRSKVAPASPLFTVGQSQPYLGRTNPAAYDYFFTPAWDARLVAMDSAGVHVILGDTAYPGRSRSSFNNLDELRRHVLLP
ncbi:hypothetical protein FJY68_13750 [candidate division WOR-3 bacterium]|uniref:Putative Flp pilus-assembly TadG-like N-terminal domain-containing protein n=1 Tax=candidate division WOR-3 bacterium TaxID=2052148 RepID=A0A937XKA8_UNCW3|nr:hypothetical protein [candidate division WOR-3 bacterium]